MEPSRTGGASSAAPSTTQERVCQWSTYQPWLQEDPVSYWKEMRDHTALARSEAAGGCWIFTRYEDIEWAAKNPDIFSNAQHVVPHRQLFPAKQIPLQLDGEEHRKWRLTLSELFNPATVNHFTPQIRQAAAEAVEPLAERRTFEFMEEFAAVLTAETFLITFGIGRDKLKALVDHKTWLRRVGIPSARTDDEIRAANQPLWDFFGEAVDRRRAAGTAGERDVISRLLEASYDGRPPTRDEMINALFVSMLASLDTTNSALGLIFLYLAEHPEVQRMVIETPERIPRIVEELLRHEPVSTTGRLVTRDVDRHGVTLRAGDRVLMSWGMSGLDPEVFQDPDTVDFDRPSSRHLAFGIGPHRCLGMHLARRVLHVALEEWHARIPSFGLAPATVPVHHYSPARGLLRLDLGVV